MQRWSIFVLALFVFVAPPALAADRPNVVLIVADDQGWTDFGFMGHPDIKTPHLDKLAASGATFPNSYAAAPLCRASLATLLTGLYPHQHKICCNDPPNKDDRAVMHPFIKSAPALPRLLKEAGYRSLQTGKFWEGHFSNAGFTHGQTTDKDRHIATQTPQIGRTTLQPIFDFIDESGKTPFFVWYAPMMPHLPHTPPERLLKKYTVEGRSIHQARYFAMCDWLDETCGDLLAYLDKKGLRQQTLVAFVVDNGWVQADQGPLGPYGGERGKRSPYEKGIRTPVILNWPGHTPAGRHTDLVSTIDVVPTILTACGVKPPPAMQGVSLLDVAAGKGPLQRSAVFGENYRHGATDLEKVTLDRINLWVRAGNWKLITHEPERKKIELFNVQADPHETKDLAQANPEKVKELLKLLETWDRR